MVVAFVIPGLGAGGAERVVSALANRWAGQGHEVHIVLIGRTERPYYPLHPGIEVHALDRAHPSRNAREAVAANFARISALRRRLRRLRPDAVLSFLPETNVLALLSGRVARPLIVAERNAPALQDLGRMWNGLRRLTWRFADHVVFQTERVRDDVGVPCQRSSVIPNAVEPPHHPTPLDRDSRSIVAVGRLVPQKGFDVLIEAFARIAARHRCWRLTIFGEGPERPRLEALIARHGLGERVELPGTTAVPGAWLRDAGLFVLSSRFEGFPNVLLEAMAAGLPVIACDCRYGPREIVSHGRDGLLTATDDARAMAEALDRLISNPAKRAALGAAARASVQRFAPDAVGRQWDALLDRLVARQRPALAAGTA